MKSASHVKSRVSTGGKKKTPASLHGRGAQGTKTIRTKSPKEIVKSEEKLRHRYHGNILCKTDTRGYSTPKNRSPLEIVVNANGGFIPLWAKGSILRWRFQELALSRIENPEAVRSKVRALLAKSISLWGTSVPVKFTEREDAWDFEIVVESRPDCDISGCVLASAFFPDGGQHELVIYPTLFEQSEVEQIETMAHELGHVFGLRHFFAQVSEAAWPSEIFGAHTPFSIMNYGSKSVMTDEDRADLARLYRGVWSGSITNINGTPIRLFEPFSSTRNRRSLDAISTARCPCCGTT